MGTEALAAADLGHMVCGISHLGGGCHSEGWYGEEGGRRVQDGGHMYGHDDSCKCMAKTITIL